LSDLDEGLVLTPIADSALLSAKLVRNGTHPGLSHSMATTHADLIGAAR
jgi:hypothetical protein